MRNIPTGSIIQAACAMSLLVATTAAAPTCSKDGDASAATQNVASASAAPAAALSATSSATSGLPADFPMAPGLSPCRPIVTGPETICEWHNVDGHAIYTFYHEALPKAGYTLRKGAGEVTSPHYLGIIGFEKGKLKGAVTIPNTDLTIQVVTVQ